MKITDLKLEFHVSPISSSEESLVKNHNFLIQFEAHLTTTRLHELNIVYYEGKEFIIICINNNSGQ